MPRAQWRFPLNSHPPIPPHLPPVRGKHPLTNISRVFSQLMDSCQLEGYMTDSVALVSHPVTRCLGGLGLCPAEGMWEKTQVPETALLFLVGMLEPESLTETGQFSNKMCSWSVGA